MAHASWTSPYLALSAILMAGIDGMINEIVPPAPIDQDLYELPHEEAAKIKDASKSGRRSVLLLINREGDLRFVALRIEAG